MRTRDEVFEVVAEPMKDRGIPRAYVPYKENR